MKLFKLLTLVLGLTLLFSCSEETANETINQEIKTIKLQYKDQEFAINYSIINGDIQLSEELSEELKSLQNNKNLWLQADQNNNLILSEKVKTTTEARSFGLNIPKNTTFFNQFGLSKINHYGFVSDNLTQQMQTLADEYYIPVWYKPQLKSYQYYENNTEVDYDVNLIFGFHYFNQLEPIQANPNQDNIFGRAAKNNPGFHHYGFSVKNLDTVVKKFNDAGYTTECSAVFETKGGLVSKLTFVNTTADVGAYTELVEAKLLGFNVEQNEGLLILGLFLGDVTLEYL